MELNENNLSFGIDLGIASVGWAVMDLANDKIVDKGVYLFTEADKAEERRIARGVRRRKKRKHHRVERIYELLESRNICFNNISDSNLLEKRLNGLNSKIEMQDIVNIIFYFARHRGYIPYKDDDERTCELVDKLRAQGLYACEIQKQIFDDIEKYRGSDLIFQHEDYMKELNTILLNQGQYYPIIDTDFINEINVILNSKRKFWEGPGGPRENQLNKYGRYKTLDDIEKYKENPNYNKYLFESLIGNCSVYKDEKKASAWNFYAECFNFYNDIVNLKIDNQNLDETNRKFFCSISNTTSQLTSESIAKLKEEVLKSKNVKYKDLFKNLFNVDFENIYGYKKDSDGKPEIAKFEKIRYIKNKLNNNKFVEEFLNNIDAYNKAVYFIQVSPDKNTRYEILKDNLLEFYDEDLLKILSECTLENRYHKFSERALKNYLVLMEEHNENSSYIERKFADEIKSDIEEEMIIQYVKNIEQGNLKYINSKGIDEIIASPATKKSLRKAIAIINKLFKKYGYPQYINIENTRELLSEEAQREYEAKMLDNTRKRNTAKKKLIEMGYEDSDNNIDKYLLLEETNWKCAYCNKDITINNCEIEHILPISITCDDTFCNKTVSCTQCNDQKDNRSPFEFLSPKGIYTDFKERVQKNSKISNDKKRNLLFEQNLNKYEKKFKNRNLNDTAYATNELANQINLFKKAYTYCNYGEILNTRILKIPGQFTGIIRKRANLEKDRSFKCHHAIDATIVASIPKLRIGRLIDLIQNEQDKYWNDVKLNEYGENLYSELFISNKLKEQLNKTDYSNTRFAQDIQIKKNGTLFDSNVSKVIMKNNEYYKINQIDNIYSIMPADFDKMFNENVYFLCKDNNPELYNRLFEIVKMYKGKKVNPFVEYCKENNVPENEPFDYRKHGIRQSQNSDSSVVIRLRYFSKVNNPYILNNSKLVISSKENKKEPMLMYDSLKSYCTRIYKDDSKLYFMPIYKIFIDNKTGKIRTDHEYYKKTYDLYVGKDLKDLEYYMDIFINDYIVFEDKKGQTFEGLAGGFHKTLNKIEIKNCSASITAYTKKIKKIKYDVLGLYNLNIK